MSSNEVTREKERHAQRTTGIFGGVNVSRIRGGERK